MRRALIVLLVAVSLLATAACSSDSKPAADGGKPSTSAKPTTTTEPPKVAAPLTGVLVAPGSVAHAAVTVKIDNTEAGRPQAGLERADVVYEERVEGGVSRMIAVFHSQDADLVGPIRSVRTSDGPIVGPLGGVFAFSDGTPAVVKSLRSVPVKAVYEMQGAGPFVYPPGRNRPLKTFAKTARLREEATKQDPPPALFGFRAAGEALAGTTPAAKATFAFGQRSSVVFDFDAASGRWLRTSNGKAHTLADGSRLGFTNVIIQTVAYRSVGYRDSSGTMVDEAVSVGSGEAILLSGGAQLKLRWSKGSPTAVTQFTDAAGAPVKLAPGTTWVGLVPTGSAITVA